MIDALSDGEWHPAWCAGGHHCTVRRGVGEHRSRPEVWRTALGRLVATRFRAASGREHLELRFVLPLPEAREAVRQYVIRRLIVRVYAAMAGRKR